MPCDDSSSKRVQCPEGNGPHCFDHGPKCCHCGACDHSTCGWKPRYDDQGRLLEPEEPPLTPEEEEQAPVDTWDPVHHDQDQCEEPSQCLVHSRRTAEPPPEDVAAKRAADELIRHDEEAGLYEPPPQPERRAPYAVTYSVQGHLYEVALPGDANVQAVDGALIIQHHLGPVAGIVQVLPIISEETPHGAEADQ